MTTLKRWTSDRGTALVALALILLMLWPMVVGVWFANPSADDYSRMGDMRAAYSRGDGLGAYVSAVIRLSNAMYTDWQGCYSVNYAIHLNPMAIWQRGYLLTYGGIVLLFPLVCYAFSNTVLRHLLDDDRLSHRLWLTAALLFLCTQFINPAESFYWYAGIVAYTLPFLLMMLTVVTMVRCHVATGTARWVWFALTLVLTILNGGGCLMLSFVIPLALAAVLAARLLARRRDWPIYMVYLVVAVVALAVQVLSPGSAVRMGRFTHHTPLYTVLLAAETALETFTAQVGLYPLIATLLALSPLALSAGARSKRRFPLPGLVLLVSAALYAAAYAPVLYGYGGYSVPPRYANTLFFLLVFLLMGNLYYIAGWLARRQVFRFDTPAKRLVLGALVVVALVTSLGDHPFIRWTSPAITRGLVSRSVQTYKQANDDILAKLRSSRGKDVELTLPKYNVTFFKTFDLQKDPKYYSNQWMAEYFGNRSIVAHPAGTK